MGTNLALDVYDRRLWIETSMRTADQMLQFTRLLLHLRCQKQTCCADVLHEIKYTNLMIDEILTTQL